MLLEVSFERVWEGSKLGTNKTPDMAWIVPLCVSELRILPSRAAQKGSMAEM